MRLENSYLSFITHSMLTETVPGLIYHWESDVKERESWLEHILITLFADTTARYIEKRPLKLF